VVIRVACRAHKFTQAVGVVIPTICMQMHVTLNVLKLLLLRIESKSINFDRISFCGPVVSPYVFYPESREFAVFQNS
jgi:hypothetical protein